MKRINDRFVALTGVIHIHTAFSDGTIPIEKVIDAAREEQLDFIIVTDHMTLEGKNQGYEGKYGELLTLVGYEHNDRNDKNHYLAIGLDSVVGKHLTPQEYISEIKGMGGIGFIAHPAEQRSYFKRYPSYPWTAWDARGYDGIELWNHMSEWIENFRRVHNLFAILYPRRLLKGVPPKLLRFWDQINKEQFISGIGGADAHSFNMKKWFISFTILPIQVTLKGIRTHVYVSPQWQALPVEEAKRCLITALSDGTGFFSNYRRGDAALFSCFLECNDGSIVPPGRSKGEYRLPALLNVSLPEKAEIRLYRNGTCEGSIKATSASFSINDRGLYRIEAYKGKYAWIYSNPFPVGTYPFT